ncbi:MAG: ORF6N domain-containing protein [Candidatus Gastranaerophilaceae bacterium]
MNELVPVEIIENKIFVIRGEKVMLDRDLAQLYEIETKRLNEAVKRNIERFPAGFMFKLTKDEFKELVANCDRLSPLKHSSTEPFVFTEHGALMLSSVLNSKKAINVSIQIIEVFNKLRKFALSQNQLAERISSLEQAFMNYSKDNNEDIEDLQRAVSYLLDITKPATIGFKG